jgi:hypothetical protein
MFLKLLHHHESSLYNPDQGSELFYRSTKFLLISFILGLFNDADTSLGNLSLRMCMDKTHIMSNGRVV